MLIFVGICAARQYNIDTASQQKLEGIPTTIYSEVLDNADEDLKV